MKINKKKSENNLYNNYISTHYREINSDLDHSYEVRSYFWQSYLNKILKLNKNINVLEVGCGMGHNLMVLKNNGFTKISGIDYSPECIAHCKKNGLNANLVHDGDSTFYENHKQKYDLVVLYDVLEHFTPIEGIELISDIKKILKNNGQLLICIPNADHPLNNKIFYADITHKFMYNKISLNQLLLNCHIEDNLFFQANSITYSDKNIVNKIIKNTLLRFLGFLGESFWKIIGLTQGIVYNECKPTLICISEVNQQ